MRRAARGAILQALSEPTKRRDGLYVGQIGVALVATQAAMRLGDEELAVKSRRLVELSCETAAESPDLLCGHAGMIVALIVLARAYPSSGLIDRAVVLGEHLLRTAEVSGQGAMSWSNPGVDSAGNLTGLSHGAAGVALALAQLGHLTGEDKFLGAVREAIEYEDLLFDSRCANWPDLRTFFRARDALPTYANFWCHGAPGIVLQRSGLGELGLDTAPWSSKSEQAFEAFLLTVAASTDRYGENFSLCHGVAGNSEILWEAGSRVSGNEDLRVRAITSARSCMTSGANAYSSAGDWPCGAIGDSPGLFLGRAGIGYSYLRFHDPSVPSVLAITPKDWFDHDC
jgi:lantibiotic modifying enzyme